MSTQKEEHNYFDPIDIAEISDNIKYFYEEQAFDYVSEKMNLAVEKGINIGIKEFYNAIKKHLCREDEDYDKPIISPKFLVDIMEQIISDGI